MEITAIYITLWVILAVGVVIQGWLHVDSLKNKLSLVKVVSYKTKHNNEDGTCKVELVTTDGSESFIDNNSFIKLILSKAKNVNNIEAVYLDDKFSGFRIGTSVYTIGKNELSPLSTNTFKYLVYGMLVLGLAINPTSWGTLAFLTVVPVALILADKMLDLSINKN